MFRWTGPGQLTAKEAASVPTTRSGRLYAKAKAILLGRPLASDSLTASPHVSSCDDGSTKILFDCFNSNAKPAA